MRSKAATSPLRTEIRLKISGDLGELKSVRDAVRAFLDSTRHIDMDGEDGALDTIAQSRIILAIDEAVANIIEHGFDTPEALQNAEISLTMRKSPQQVEFEIEDNGKPYNPLEHKPDTEIYYEEGLENGIGLIAITTLDAEYVRIAEKNLLTLKRSWDKP